jgi:hypothetical protein
VTGALAIPGAGRAFTGNWFLTPVKKLLALLWAWWIKFIVNRGLAGFTVFRKFAYPELELRFRNDFGAGLHAVCRALDHVVSDNCAAKCSSKSV